MVQRYHVNLHILQKNGPSQSVAKMSKFDIIKRAYYILNSNEVIKKYIFKYLYNFTLI